MRILQIVFLLSVCGCPQALRVPISDILEIAKLSKDVTVDLFKTLKSLDEVVGLSPNASKSVRQSILFKEFEVFNNKIDMFNAQLEGVGSQVLNAIVNYTDVQFQMKLKLLEANENIYFVYLKYKEMGTFIKNKVPYDDLTLKEFARSLVLRSNSSLQSALNRIHAIIAPEEDDHYEEDENYHVDGVPSVFKILMQIMREEGNELFCYTNTSAQQVLFKLYNTLALTELKGFLMMEFSYMILKLHNRGNFTKNIVTAQERYKDRSGTTLKLTIEAVQSAPTEFWKCDPHKQVKNETYIEITELLQGYIENEEDLNLEPRSCYHICYLYNYEEKSNKCYDYEGQHPFCNKNRQCKGKIYNCYFIPTATVCHADAGTNRRYEYIELKQNVLGRKKECAHNSTRFQEWLRGWYSCDYCMCLCDEQGVNSDRYFNLRSSESDFHDNMVVTGLRFVKKNRIIHLQIQEGKLLPMGKIDVTTVRWKPVEDYRIDDPGVHNGRDYHTLTYEKRGFNLDDLVRYEEELLTGVKFTMAGSHLNFQIRMTPFNFTSGKLQVRKSLWWHLKMQKDRKMVNLQHKDIPIRSPDPSLPVSESGMYLEFQHSDWDMDVAQTTVPFIDAQAVALAQPVPLSGAGVMYKGSNNFGGFIYAKIMTYNYSKVLHNIYNDNNYIYI